MVNFSASTYSILLDFYEFLETYRLYVDRGYTADYTWLDSHISDMNFTVLTADLKTANSITETGDYANTTACETAWAASITALNTMLHDSTMDQYGMLGHIRRCEQIIDMYINNFLPSYLAGSSGGGGSEEVLAAISSSEASIKATIYSQC